MEMKTKAERDKARKECRFYGAPSVDFFLEALDAADELERERDEARAGLDDIRDEWRAQFAFHAQAVADAHGMDRGLVAMVERLRRERDEARADNTKMLAVVDAARKGKGGHKRGCPAPDHECECGETRLIQALAALDQETHDPHEDPECIKCGHVMSDHPTKYSCGAVMSDDGPCECSGFKGALDQETSAAVAAKSADESLTVRMLRDDVERLTKENAELRAGVSRHLDRALASGGDEVRTTSDDIDPPHLGETMAEWVDRVAPTSDDAEQAARKWLDRYWEGAQPSGSESLAALLRQREQAARADEREKTIEECAKLLEDRHDAEFSNPHAVDWSLAQAAQKLRALKSGGAK